MLNTILIAALALASPPAEAAPDDTPNPIAAVPASITDYLDTVCADLPDETCAPLYAMVETLRAVIGPIPKEWCCEACKSGPDKVRTACSGCSEKGAWACGSLRHIRRALLASCSDPYTYDEGSGALNCY